MLYLLPSIPNLPAKDSSKDHLDVFNKTVVAIVVAVQANLVRINHIVIVPHRNLLITHRRKIRQRLKLHRINIFPPAHHSKH